MSKNKSEIWDEFKSKTPVVLKWVLFSILLFFALMFFAIGNGLAAFSTILISLAICPPVSKLYEKYHIKKWQKNTLLWGLIILTFLFIIFHEYSNEDKSKEAPSSVSSFVSLEEFKDKSVSSVSLSKEEKKPVSIENFSDDDSSPVLDVYFLDVGQGDATLLQCDGHNMLIDCGPEDSGTKIQLFLKKHDVEKLDYLILTHPDADHIGGADVIITKFDIDNIFMLDYPKDSKAYLNLMDAISYKGYFWQQPEITSEYSLGAAYFTILGPLTYYDDVNNSSIITKVTYGKNRLLFTGDCQEAGESDLVMAGYDILADIYKAGHHGSHTSSSEWFVDMVNPSAAVISCGRDNSYGHPHEEVLNIFNNRGISILRTDTMGTIHASCDGETIEISY